MNNNLKTPYENGGIPFNIYPRPTLKRNSFLNLNGKWDFKVYLKGKKVFDGKILVPMPPESHASLVNKRFDKNSVLVYETTFKINENFINDNIILHFGAVDNICEIYVNNKRVGEHVGGYLPFEFNIKDYVKRRKGILKYMLDKSDKKPTLGILLVGNNPASEKYLFKKEFILSIKNIPKTSFYSNNPYTPEELKEIVRKIKYRYHLTQKEIAEQIGVNSQYLSNVLNGRYPYTDELKKKIYQQFKDLEESQYKQSNDDEAIIKELQLRIVRLEAENNLLRELAGLNNRSEKNAL